MRRDRRRSWPSPGWSTCGSVSARRRVRARLARRARRARRWSGRSSPAIVAGVARQSVSGRVSSLARTSRALRLRLRPTRVCRTSRVPNMSMSNGLRSSPTSCATSACKLRHIRSTTARSCRVIRARVLQLARIRHEVVQRDVARGVQPSTVRGLASLRLNQRTSLYRRRRRCDRMCGGGSRVRLTCDPPRAVAPPVDLRRRAGAHLVSDCSAPLIAQFLVRSAGRPSKEARRGRVRTPARPIRCR